MKYQIHEVEVNEEFKDCPLCDYKDGFHTMMKKIDGKFKRFYICPRCHAVFDPKFDEELE
ncbi:MAG: hypothetical protein GY750_09530 [Lentisphaerae bacterium]|nr:hypothetical protein [Lentisphaerota bacterium]MCP4101653.1 hypothetical protein [Lentisphaerota bacterium]